MNRKLRDLLLGINIVKQIGEIDKPICDIVFDSRKVKKIVYSLLKRERRLTDTILLILQ